MSFVKMHTRCPLSLQSRSLGQVKVSESRIPLNFTMATSELCKLAWGNLISPKNHPFWRAEASLRLPLALQVYMKCTFWHEAHGVLDPSCFSNIPSPLPCTVTKTECTKGQTKLSQLQDANLGPSNPPSLPQTCGHTDIQRHPCYICI